MGNQLPSIGGTGNEPTKDSIFTLPGSSNDQICPKLTLQQRVIGFLACSIVGFALSWIITFVFVFSGFDVKTYAIIFSMCQILNIGASCFLSTPKGHLKAMKKKHRIIPSALYIIMIILTIVLAVATQIKGLVLFCVILTTICYYWYTISFIPFGTKILKKICGACFDMDG